MSLINTNEYDDSGSDIDLVAIVRQSQKPLEHGNDRNVNIFSQDKLSKEDNYNSKTKSREDSKPKVPKNSYYSSSSSDDDYYQSIINRTAYNLSTKQKDEVTQRLKTKTKSRLSDELSSESSYNSSNNNNNGNSNTSIRRNHSKYNSKTLRSDGSYDSFENAKPSKKKPKKLDSLKYLKYRNMNNTRCNDEDTTDEEMSIVATSKNNSHRSRQKRDLFDEDYSSTNEENNLKTKLNTPVKLSKNKDPARFLKCNINNKSIKQTKMSSIKNNHQPSSDDEYASHEECNFSTKRNDSIQIPNYMDPARFLKCNDNQSKKKPKQALMKQKEQLSVNKKSHTKKKKRNQHYDDDSTDIDMDMDMDTNMDSDDEYHGDLDSQLKPDFPNPELGVGPLEPFFLTIRENNTDSNKLPQHQVPASINRYLQEYQREGIKFMYTAISQNNGAILGDDMGLGKTIQVISLIAALQQKSGTKKDLLILNERQKLIEQEIRETRDAKTTALLYGNIVQEESITAKTGIESLNTIFQPILILVPPSLVDNWGEELSRWGYFSVVKYNESKGDDRVNILNRIHQGMDDILICPTSLIKDLNAKSKLKWKLVIVDELHHCKNNKGTMYLGLMKIRKNSECPILGLTGTLTQNNLKELWTLVDLIQPDLLSDYKSFSIDYVRPITVGRSKKATDETSRRGDKQSLELNRLLKRVFLKRYKDDVLKDKLTTKNQKVVFCELASIQKQLYQRVLELPDFKCLRLSTGPCDCGVNRNFFIGYQKLKTTAEKIEYRKRRGREVIARKDCCHKLPWNPKGQDEGEPKIDPNAVLWRGLHSDDEPCKQCPACIGFPALMKLTKICSHPSLLQVDNNLNENDMGRKDVAKLEFAKIAIGPDLVNELPGKSYFRSDSIMDEHIHLSGKLKTLDICLNRFNYHGDRVLIFSNYVETLDLIQNYIKAKGYTFSRIDGHTKSDKRQSLIDEYQNDPNIFIFLISTRAGGVGLNLTAANKVIIFDVNWNPSHDEQAQDRAFRIGQKRDVDVIRLVAQGTLEELQYWRQIYKIHIKKTVEDTDDSRVEPGKIFSGVDKDKERKGELFGMENLLQYKEGSFMRDWWRGNSAQPKTHQIFDESAMVTNCNLSSMTEDDVIGMGEEDDLEKICINAVDKLHVEDDECDEVMYGQTQNIDEVFKSSSQNLHPNNDQEAGVMSSNINSKSEVERNQEEAKAYRKKNSNRKGYIDIDEYAPQGTSKFMLMGEIRIISDDKRREYPPFLYVPAYLKPSSNTNT